jgi:exodeoxyribonuclease V alpha subunit
LKLSPELAAKLEISPFRALDRQFARFLISRCRADEATALAGAVTSALLEQGHDCLPIEIQSAIPWGDEDGKKIDLPPAAEWIKALEASPAVGKPGDRSPLILDAGSLYMYKYFSFEEAIAKSIKAMSATVEVAIHGEVIALAREIVKGTKDLSDSGGQLQTAGALMPFFSRFSIITGGPGTGKTTVLAAMLALLCTEAGLKKEAFPTICIAAPTGKAAQRMGDSIRSFLNDMPQTQVTAHLSKIAPSTLHRLLGLYGDSPKPKRDARLPIEADIIVVDEASMMDISMFGRLIDALSPTARLILLGDRHQLESVQAGCILADICNAFPPNCFTDAFAGTVNNAITEPNNYIKAIISSTVLSPVVELMHSFRFPGLQPIGRVSAAIKANNADLSIDILKSVQSADEYCKFSDQKTSQDLEAFILKKYARLFDFTEATESEDALTQLGKFMVLTVVNEGAFGRVGINESVRKLKGGNLSVIPIKITENSLRHNLYNGDMGVIIRKKNTEGELVERAWFPEAGNVEGTGPVPKNTDRTMLSNRRQFLVGALPSFVDAFAITIHNSQGSEFDKVVIVLPEKNMSILTREILYTAITRAKTTAEIYGLENIFKGAVENKISRHSGLANRLSDHLYKYLDNNLNKRETR